MLAWRTERKCLGWIEAHDAGSCYLWNQTARCILVSCATLWRSDDGSLLIFLSLLRLVKADDGSQLSQGAFVSLGHGLACLDKERWCGILSCIQSSCVLRPISGLRLFIFRCCSRAYGLL